MKVRSEIPTAENTTNMDGFGTCEVGTTLENLKAAIGGETGASAKYAAFAQAAKEQGYEQIARLFEATSAAEQIHIGLEYALVAEVEPDFEKPAAPEAEGVQTDKDLHPVDGVFVLRDAVAPDKLVPGLATDGPHVAVDAQMRTNLPGCFACGDLAGKPYQYIKAAGQGNIAALSAVEWLAEQK